MIEGLFDNKSSEDDNEEELNSFDHFHNKQHVDRTEWFEYKEDNRTIGIKVNKETLEKLTSCSKQQRKIIFFEIIEKREQENEQEREQENSRNIEQIEKDKELISIINEKLKKFENFKLKMIAIPMQSGRNSLQKRLTKKDWNIIRNKTIELYNHKCGMCDKQLTDFNCHEMWEFDDINSTQTLKQCIPLCDLCHAGVHPNHVYGTKRMSLYDTMINFCKINNCTIEMYHEYKDFITSLEFLRSSTKFFVDDIWKMNYGEYEELVENKLGNINEELINKKKNSIFGGKYISFKTVIDIDDKETNYGIDKDGNEILLNEEVKEPKKRPQLSLLDYK